MFITIAILASLLVIGLGAFSYFTRQDHLEARTFENWRG